MQEDNGKSKKLKLYIVFGLFIGLILGLIIYQVNVYITAKKQRENIENTLKKETNKLKNYMKQEVTKESVSATDSLLMDEEESD